MGWKVLLTAFIMTHWRMRPLFSFQSVAHSSSVMLLWFLDGLVPFLKSYHCPFFLSPRLSKHAKPRCHTASRLTTAAERKDIAYGSKAWHSVSDRGTIVPRSKRLPPQKRDPSEGLTDRFPAGWQEARGIVGNCLDSPPNVRTDVVCWARNGQNGSHLVDCGHRSLSARD